MNPVQPGMAMLLAAVQAAEAQAPKAQAPKAQAPKARAPKAQIVKVQQVAKARVMKAQAPEARVMKAQAPKVMKHFYSQLLALTPNARNIFQLAQQDSEKELGTWQQRVRDLNGSPPPSIPMKADEETVAKMAKVLFPQ